MKTVSKIFLLIVLVFSLSGCAKEAEEKRMSVPLETYGESGEAAAKEILPVSDRKIIKEGEIYFESSKLVETRTYIDNAIKKCNGYISKESENKYDYRIEQSIVIRVPAEYFDTLVAEISNIITKLDRKSIEVMDVTEEYLDIELRLKIKKETENRYRELLKRARTVVDIVSIEKQIGELRAEIESIEGRLKYLQDRIAYSTLTVTFYENVSIPVGFSPKFKLGLKNGWNNFVWFVIGAINIWPFILLASLGFWSLRRYRRRKKDKRGPSKTSKRGKT